MPTVTVVTNLFTLADRHVEENAYLQMYLLWLLTLRNSGSLQAGDRHLLIIDSRSLEYLVKQTAFPDIGKTLVTPILVHTVPPPTTLLEGCLGRYTAIPFSTDCYFYMDVDILILKSIHAVVDRVTVPGLYVHGEGELETSNYGALFSPTELAAALKTFVGISSGKWLIVGRDAWDSFQESFTQVLAARSPEWNTLYTLDQPIYNYAVWKETQRGRLVDDGAFHSPVVCSNSVLSEGENADDVVLLDLCGDPGNQSMHMNKMISNFIITQLLECPTHKAQETKSP